MDLFGRKMAREGIRTVGTIERVVVTEETTGGIDPALTHDAAAFVYLWFRFTDQQGVVRTQETRTTFHPDHIPPPGGEIELRYMPKDPTKFYTYGTGPVNPAVPRGWGAGIFDVEDLGGHQAKSLLAKRTLDRQRELFRTGQRAQAEVVSVTCLNPRHLKRSVCEYSLALRAAGREIETRAWVPFRCVPQPGDLIEIAVSADGSDVALDTDERYDGPPGQALVFSTPPELAAQRPQEGSLSDQVAGQQSKLAAWQERTEAGMARIEAYRAGETPAPSSGEVSVEGAGLAGAESPPAEDNPVVARLLHQIDLSRGRPELVRKVLDAHRDGGLIDDATYEWLLKKASYAPAPSEEKVAELNEWTADMKRARPKMGRRYEKMVRATLDGQLAGGLIDTATHERLLQEALSA
jgi:hypothetical protein